MTGRSSLAFILGLALHAANARAEIVESIGKRSLDVSGTAHCATVAEFAARLRQENPGYSFPQGSPASIAVTFDPSPDGVRARVRLDQDSGVLVRELSANTCEEAVLGAIFVVTVALTPSSQVSASRSSSVPDPPPHAQAGEEQQKPRSSNAATNSQTETLRPEDPTAPVHRRSSSAARGRLALVTGLSAVVLIGPSPNPLWGVEGALGIQTERAGPWAPAFLFSASYSAAFPERTDLGTAAFDMGLLGLTACPSLVSFQRLGLRPCLVGHLGWLHAVGTETSEPQSALRPWADAGIALDGALRLTSWLRVHGALAAKIPFNDDSFRFEEEVFHTVPDVTFDLSLGLLGSFR